MSANSEIGWTDHTWPVIRGCSKVSEGCRNCWAIRDAHLHAGNKTPKQQAHFAGLTVVENGRPNWTGEVRLDEAILEWPLHWKTAARIFTASSGDLWHEKLPRGDIAGVYAMMAYCQRHTFQILTKRPEERFRYCGLENDVCEILQFLLAVYGAPPHPKPFRWPLPNVWEGVSVEDQATADERIPILLKTPAALRFVSYEPALGPVKFDPWLFPKEWGASLDWGIVGGESGPGARPCDLDWIESIVKQFRGARVPLFVKQLGSKPYSGESLHKAIHDRTTDGRLWFKTKDRKGANPREWPARILVQEFPR